MITVCTGSNSKEVLRDIMRDLSIDLEMFIRKKWDIKKDIKEKISLGKLIGHDTDLRKSYPEFEQDLSDALNYRNEEIHVKDLPKFDFEQLVKIINTYFRVYLLAFQFDPQNVPAPAPPVVQTETKETTATNQTEKWYEGEIIGTNSGYKIISSEFFGIKKIAWEGGKGTVKKGKRVSFTLKKEANGSLMEKSFELFDGTVVHNYIADQVIVLTS
jgi:hypothetical protein